MLHATLLLLAMADAGHAAFAGPVLGIEGGRQNVIAGARIGDVDVLRQEGKAAFSLIGGYRWALGARGLVGFEAGVGWLDGDLARNAGAASVEYQPKGQYHYGGLAGWVVETPHPVLLFAYLNETKRTFRVDIQQGGSRVAQEDRQGMLRFGVGIEAPIAGGLHGRITLGTTRARFEGRTDLVGSKVPELMAGLSWKFR
jgi:hypothetical protein